MSVYVPAMLFVGLPLCGIVGIILFFKYLNKKVEQYLSLHQENAEEDQFADEKIDVLSYTFSFDQLNERFVIQRNWASELLPPIHTQLDWFGLAHIADNDSSQNFMQFEFFGWLQIYMTLLLRQDGNVVYLPAALWSNCDDEELGLHLTVDGRFTIFPYFARNVNSYQVSRSISYEGMLLRLRSDGLVLKVVTNWPAFVTQVMQGELIIPVRYVEPAVVEKSTDAPAKELEPAAATPSI